MKNTTFLLIMFLMASPAIGQDVNIWISHADLQTIEISLTTTVDISGFQFHILDDDDLDAVLLEVLQQPLTPGWMVTFNPNGLVLSFDMAGGIIPAGSGGVLLEFSWEVNNADGYVWLANPVVSSYGLPIEDIELGDPVFVSGGPGPNNYLDVPSEYATIQAAINAAAHGDTVVVQPGIYYENIDCSGHNIVLTSTYLFSEDWSVVENTVIDGQQQGVVVYPVYSEIIGFTITHGSYSGGAGINISGTSPRIAHCIISNNEATTGMGGGIRIADHSSAIIENVIITNNWADAQGGGLGISYNATPIIQNCVISGNESDYGGGIYLAIGHDTVIRNTVFAYNWANSNGGGIYLAQSDIDDLENLVFYGNVAANGGGGIFCALSAEATSRNSIYWANVPEQIEFDPNGLDNGMVLDHCTIQGGAAGINTNNNGTYSWLSTLESDPLFAELSNELFALLPQSPAIDAGNPAVQYNDICFPPSQETAQNDQGLYGGPQACDWDVEVHFGCTDPDAENYDPEANAENGACQYLAVPQNLVAVGGNGQISLSWSPVQQMTSRTDVQVWISDVTPQLIELYMVNDEDMYGFQLWFQVAPEFEAEFLGTFGGSAAEAGFFSTINPGGMILSYSLAGGYVPAGEGVLTYVEWSQEPDVAGDVGIENAIFSGEAGAGLSWEAAPPFYFDPALINDDLTYNIYRDGSLYVTGVTDTLFFDSGLNLFETHCYTVTAFDGTEETPHSNLACATTNAQIVPQHFVVDLQETGESSLVVIQSAVGLEPGDEIGLFDAAGIMNFGGCDYEYGELLVGSGVWTGEQLNISAIGSVDYCLSSELLLPGYVEGNPIVIKYWSAEGDYDCTINHPEFIVGDGNWGAPLTGVTIEVPESCGFNFGCVVDPYMNNMISFNFYPDQPQFADIFGEIAFVAWNDGGEYFAPSYGVDQIGNFNVLAGYKLFSAAEEQVAVFADGFPADPGQPIMWQPNRHNFFAYLPQYPLPAADVFSPFNEDILVISNDAGEYYVPGMDVYTLTTLYPCEGYQVFLQGLDPVMFSYPLQAERQSNPASTELVDYREACRTEYFLPRRTGDSQPLVITDFGPGIEVGDEIAAYADGALIGAARIADLNRALAISCWQAVEHQNISLPGFHPGDEVELQLLKVNTGELQTLSADLNEVSFGQGPLLHGSVELAGSTLLPEQIKLHPAYPNPFNATVTLHFELPDAQMIKLDIFDLQGRHVAALLNDLQCPGNHSVTWNAGDAASGLYVVQLNTGNRFQTQKILLLK